MIKQTTGNMLDMETEGINARIVRQIDIARALGVSRSTVAAVLRKREDDPNYRIRPETEKLVLDMAEKMNYSPSILGKSLRAQRTFLAGVLNSRINFYYNSDVNAGIQAALSEKEYAPVVYTHEHTLEDEWRYLRLIVNRQIEGIIINAAVAPDGSTNNARLQALVSSIKMPMVELFGDYLDGMPSVLFNYRALAALGVERLLERGHTKIAFVVHDQVEARSAEGKDAYWTAKKMQQGYLEAMSKAGLKPMIITHRLPSSLTRHHEYYREVAANATYILDHSSKPSAVIAHNEENALALLMRQNESRPVDQRITCVAPSGVNPITHTFPQALPIQFPIQEAGMKAADLLLSMIEDPGAVSPKSVYYIEPQG